MLNTSAGASAGGGADAPALNVSGVEGYGGQYHVVTLAGPDQGSVMRDGGVLNVLDVRTSGPIPTKHIKFYLLSCFLVGLYQQNDMTPCLLELIYIGFPHNAKWSAHTAPVLVVKDRMNALTVSMTLVQALCCGRSEAQRGARRCSFLSLQCGRKARRGRRCGTMTSTCTSAWIRTAPSAL